MGDLIDFGNITINPSTKPGIDQGTRKGDSMRYGLGRLQQEILATLDEAKGGWAYQKVTPLEERQAQGPILTSSMAEV